MALSAFLLVPLSAARSQTSVDSPIVSVSNDKVDELSDSPRLVAELPFVSVAWLDVPRAKGMNNNCRRVQQSAKFLL